VRFAGLKETDSPGLEIEDVRLTVPEKPLRLLRDIVELPEESTMMDRMLGLAVMVKPGCGGELTTKVILTEWMSEPLVPVTVTA
jgi:hypothetical protein